MMRLNLVSWATPSASPASAARARRACEAAPEDEGGQGPEGGRAHVGRDQAGVRQDVRAERPEGQADECSLGPVELFRPREDDQAAHHGEQRHHHAAGVEELEVAARVEAHEVVGELLLVRRLVPPGGQRVVDRRPERQHRQGGDELHERRVVPVEAKRARLPVADPGRQVDHLVNRGVLLHQAPHRQGGLDQQQGHDGQGQTPARFQKGGRAGSVAPGRFSTVRSAGG